MKGAAERPGGADREAGPGARREPESASFAVVRVGRRGSGSALLVLAFIAVLAGMIGIAVGSQAPTEGPAGPPVAAASARPTVRPTATPAATVATVRPSPAPLLTSDPAAGQLRLAVQPQSSTMYVHGDVYVVDVTWVFVSLQDASGRVASWASVSVPGAAGPAVGSGPTLRFDVDLAVPAGFSGPLSIQANAYDNTARIIGSARLVVNPGDAP